MGKKRRKYTKEFKKESVRFIIRDDQNDPYYRLEYYDYASRQNDPAAVQLSRELNNAATGSERKRLPTQPCLHNGFIVKKCFL